MENLYIYFSEDTEVTEYEAINKGYRVDVYVKIDKKVYNLSIYTMVRLQQDFDSEVKTYGYYLPDTNLIFVRDTNKDEIINTVNWLYKKRYFDSIKQNDNIDTSKMVKVQ